MNRTHNNGELTIKNVGEKVELVGCFETEQVKRKNNKIVYLQTL